MDWKLDAQGSEEGRQWAFGDKGSRKQVKRKERLKYNPPPAVHSTSRHNAIHHQPTFLPQILWSVKLETVPRRCAFMCGRRIELGGPRIWVRSSEYENIVHRSVEVMIEGVNDRRGRVNIENSSLNQELNLKLRYISDKMKIFSDLSSINVCMGLASGLRKPSH